MKSIKMSFSTPIELEYKDNTVELTIYYLPGGIVNILCGHEVPDCHIDQIIKENYSDIIGAVIADQERIACGIREKETMPYNDLEAFLNGMNAIQRQIY